MKPSPFILLLAADDLVLTSLDVLFASTVYLNNGVSIILQRTGNAIFSVHITKCQLWAGSVSTGTFLHLCALAQAANWRNLHPVSPALSSLEACTSSVGVTEYSRCHHVACDPLTT